MFSPLFGIVLGLSCILIVGFFIWRKRFLDRQNGRLEPEQSIFYRKKYREVDLLQNNRIVFLSALAFSIAIPTIALNWTSYAKRSPIIVYPYNEHGDHDIEIALPITSEPPPPSIPLPPPPLYTEVYHLLPEEDYIEPLRPKWIDSTGIKDTPIQEEQPMIPPPPPPPPPPVPETTYCFFGPREVMPRFPGCEELEKDYEKKKCADKKLLEYIYSNIKYPPTAIDNEIEGMVVIQFAIEKDGRVTNTKIARDIGGGCGQFALEAINKMIEEDIRWTPSKQYGRPVRVQYNMPVRFRLTDDGIKAIRPPKAEEFDHDKIYTIVEQMPRFPGCEDGSRTEKKKKNCADGKMLKFIYKHFRNPNPQADVEGLIVARFVVEKDGSLSNIETVKDIGNIFDEELVRVIYLMNEMGYRWNPGKLNDKTVRVQFHLPVRIHLQ